MKTISTKKLVATALFTSIITIATMFIRIPLPFGYVNLGDAFILLAVFILGPIYGVICAGVGSAIADLLGYPQYTLGTLIIKTLMAIAIYFVYRLIKVSTKKDILAEIISGIVGTLIMAFGYFLYEIIFFISPAVAIINVPFNILQGVVGTVIAASIMHVLKKTKVLDKLENIRSDKYEN